MPRTKYFNPELDVRDEEESQREHYKKQARKIYIDLVETYGSESVLDYLARQTDVKADIINDWFADKPAVFFGNSDKLILKALEQATPADFETK